MQLCCSHLPMGKVMRRQKILALLLKSFSECIDLYVGVNARLVCDILFIFHVTFYNVIVFKLTFSSNIFFSCFISSTPDWASTNKRRSSVCCATNERYFRNISSVSSASSSSFERSSCVSRCKAPTLDSD